MSKLDSTWVKAQIELTREEIDAECAKSHQVCYCSSHLNTLIERIETKERENE